MDLTAETVELMTPKQLVEAYNRVAGTIGLDAVKRFATRADGVKRVLRALPAFHAELARRESAGRARRAVTELKAGDTVTVTGAKPKKLNGTRVVTKAPSMASRIRDGVRAGLTNDQIFAAVGLPDDKRWHVAWHRADMRRRGLDMGKGAASDPTAA